MSTLAQTVLTLSDWAKRLDPDGKVPLIVEALAQKNRILDDMLWKEGNLPTGDRATIRTGLPTVGWRLLNQGSASSKSTTGQVDFSCGMMDAWSTVDVKLANLGGNTEAFRLSEAVAFIEAMSQEMASTLFYGNATTAPEEFTGLAPLYSDPSAVNGSNVIDAGSTDVDNTSIWLIGWGGETVYGCFPKGSQAGLKHEDHGQQIIQTSTDLGGTVLLAYVDHFTWDAGFVLKDWRFACRIGSIDVSNLVAKSSAADLLELMIKATWRMPDIGSARFAWYMNRTTAQMLDIQNRDDAISGSTWKTEVVDGKPVTSFRGIPVKICDAILNTEAVV